MKDSLPVRADQGDPPRRDSKTLASSEGSLSKDLAEAKVELTQFTGGDRLLFRYTQNLLANVRWEGNGGMREQLRAQPRRWAGDFRQSDVNRVGGGAGHQAEDEHGRLWHRGCVGI